MKATNFDLEKTLKWLDLRTRRRYSNLHQELEPLHPTFEQLRLPCQGIFSQLLSIVHLFKIFYLPDQQHEQDQPDSKKARLEH